MTSLLWLLNSIVQSIIILYLVGEISSVNDPDYGKSAPELIESRGFGAETHTTITDDGYILVLYRIINPSMFPTIRKRPIILHHGLLASAFTWILADPFGHLNDSVPTSNLAFALAKLGYDVWLPNSRGNGISTEHKWLDSNSKQFWDFSFDELIQKDLPAVIKYIQEATASQTVGYVGHSQGTLIMFGLLSLQPQYAEIIKPYIAIAPVAYVNSAKGTIFVFYPFKSLLQSIGGPLIFNQDSMLSGSEFCKITPAGCAAVLDSIAGRLKSNQINDSRINVYMKNELLTTSARNLVHYFVNYDMKQYGCYEISGFTFSFGSCNYDIGNIRSTDIALISGDADNLADVDDLNILRSKLKDVVLPKWGHLDLVWGVDAHEQVGQVVVGLLEKYRNLP